MRENFEKYGDDLAMSRQLVTLKTDVEFEFDPEACRFTGLNIEALRRAPCGVLGFAIAAQADRVEADATPKPATRRSRSRRPKRGSGSTRRCSATSAPPAATTGDAARSPPALRDSADVQVSRWSTPRRSSRQFLDGAEEAEAIRVRHRDRQLGAMSVEPRRHELQLGGRDGLLRPGARARRGRRCWSATRCSQALKPILEDERSRRSATTSSTTCS